MKFGTTNNHVTISDITCHLLYFNFQLAYNCFRMEKSNSRLQVKNKAPAAVQITAEQLMREAKERELEVVAPPPKQKISDPTELADYKLRKRKEFEDNLRKNRMNISHWLKYASWEESQGEIERARSIFERALDATGSRTITIWLRYIEMEMKNRQVKHARTLFDRATYILPRVNQFWYKYVYFEEILGNIPYCREVFERWIKFLPGEQEWQTYINFEMRYKEIDRAREIYSKYLMLHPEPKNWIKFAKFEERHSSAENARQVFELGLEFFGDRLCDEQFFIAFAQFEERQHEYERVKLIYDYALNKLPRDKAPELYENFSNFQKKHGGQEDIENLISHKRKLIYENRLVTNPYDYDTWFDYIQMAEEEFTFEEVEDIYERAVANTPRNRTNKDHWRRYVYLWIYYATFEELIVKDAEKAFKVYEFCINDLIPHKQFTFAKLWLLAAKLQIRIGNIDKARYILDKSLKRCPKRKLFKEYIDLEIQLREFNNCRRLYEKFLQRAPDDSSVWISYAELEAILCETVRARAIYKAAIDRANLDSPENVWKAYIDFEIEQEEYKNVEDLYEQLLNRTNHVKVWLSYAQFYEDLKDILKARKIFERANERLREEEPLARVVLLESWQEFEGRQGEAGIDISSKMPSKVRKRKRMDDADEDDWVEYYEYVFPDADKKKSSLMDRVKRWKEERSKEEPSVV